MSFVPAFVHEEDDRLDVRCSSQPSFHRLQEEIETYDEDFAENPYIQAIPKDVWRSLYGQPLSCIELPAQPQFFDDEPAVLRKIVEEYVAHGEHDTFAVAMDRVVDFCLLGKETFGPGSTRVSEICDECFEPLDKDFVA